MNSAQVKKIIINAFKSKRLFFWFFIRFISSFGPLAVTYLFAYGVEVIEEGRGFNDIILVFFALLLVESTEHILRILSKTRVVYMTEYAIINIQEELIKNVPKDDPKRKEHVQTLRNLTQSIRRFVIKFKDSGIPALVSFVSIPVILFFVDVKIFYLQVALMVIYMIITYVSASIYEKRYEDLDHSREDYFSNIHSHNHIDPLAAIVRNNVKNLNDLIFVNWVSLQNIISVFKFITIYLVVKDIMIGAHNVSSLILIVGYVRESKVFLNDMTSMFELYMQVKAGIKRVVSVSDDGLMIHYE